LHQQGQQHAGIACCEQDAGRIGQLVAGLALIHEALEPSEMAGAVAIAPTAQEFEAHPTLR